MAGLGNKDTNFWEILEDWDIIVCTETWVEERSWKRAKNKLPKEFRWETHIRDRVKKGAAVMGQVWGLGKRRFGSE